MTRRRPTPCTIPDHATRRIADAELAVAGEPYDIIALLAHGGMSTVYLARHRPTGERVAIKALDAASLGHADRVVQLLGEYELARRVRHPGLLDIRCAAQTAHGVPFLVMEYLDGESLGALADRQRLPTAGALAIAAQIAEAASALHAAGVVHCDLKPDNVLVLREPAPGGGPRVKVIDYGVARLADEPPPRDGEVMGTPAFMAPEQWRGAPGPASDVYALGCVLYELVTGAPLFTGSLPQLMTAHCERAPERPSLRCRGLDPAVDQVIEQVIERVIDQVIERALAKRPSDRPAMAELATALAELAARADAEPAGAQEFLSDPARAARRGLARVPVLRAA